MSDQLSNNAHRKQLMAYLRYLCRENGMDPDANPRESVASLAGEDMSFRECLAWLDNRMRIYPPPSYVKPMERGQTLDYAKPVKAKKRKKATQWDKALHKARCREGSRAGHARKLARDAAIVARAEARMQRHRGEKPKSTQTPKQRKWSFYKSAAWLSLRAKVYEKYKGKCCLCGRSHREDGVKIHADHIKPRSTHPRLELVEDNIQLLCEDCNLGKGNKYQTDWRPAL